MVSQEEFQEWKHHPVTQEFFLYLKECRESLGMSSTLRETADLTLKATAYKEGQMDMIESMRNVDFAEG